MKLYQYFSPPLPRTALTLGCFDGVHRGHQSLLHRLKITGGHTTVITFQTHPLRLLQPNHPFPGWIVPPDFKLTLLEAFSLDAVIAIPFTQEIAELSFEEFLSPFSISHLILGEGSSFGKKRGGTPEAVKKWAQEKNCQIHYLPKEAVEGTEVSSGRIRRAIQEGDLQTASLLLGRPYSLPFPAHTLQLDLPLLCLPPSGIYSVWAEAASYTLSIEHHTLRLSRPLMCPTLLRFQTT